MKIRPLVKEVTERLNTHLSLETNFQDIESTIELGDIRKAESHSQQIENKLILYISDIEVKKGTIGYELSKDIAEFTFQRATKYIFKKDKKLLAAVQREILPPALSKIASEYSDKFVAGSLADEDLASDFALCTDDPTYFKREVEPIISKPDHHEKQILDKISKDADKRKHKINPSSQVYEKFVRDATMGSRITPEEAVRQTIDYDEQTTEYFQYVKVLKYIFDKPNADRQDIAKSKKIPYITVHWSTWKLKDNMGLIKNADKTNQTFVVSEKYEQIREKLLNPKK